MRMKGFVFLRNYHLLTFNKIICKNLKHFCKNLKYFLSEEQQNKIYFVRSTAKECGALIADNFE